MIRWTPTTSPPPPQRWQSRDEILKAHLDSLSPDELRRLRPSYYWQRYGWPAWQRELARKYDPNQPRVPAGNSDGGQWTRDSAEGNEGSDETGPESTREGRQPAPYQLAAVGEKRSAAYCWNQLLIDNIFCGALRPRSRVAACRGQATQRYAACLAGQPIPPLPF